MFEQRSRIINILKFWQYTTRFLDKKICNELFSPIVHTQAFVVYMLVMLQIFSKKNIQLNKFLKAFWKNSSVFPQNFLMYNLLNKVSDKFCKKFYKLTNLTGTQCLKSFFRRKIKHTKFALKRNFFPTTGFAQKFIDQSPNHSLSCMQVSIMCFYFMLQMTGCKFSNIQRSTPAVTRGLGQIPPHSNEKDFCFYCVSCKFLIYRPDKF